MRFRHKKKTNYFYVVMLILLLTSFLLRKIGDNLLYHIENIVIKNVDKMIYDSIFFTFSNEELGNEELLNVINLNMNKNDEVISVDYKFDIAYKYLSEGMEFLYNDINDIELEGYDKEDGGIYYFPVGLVNNNLLLDNFGFKIPCKVRFVHDMDMGFKTKVTNYGVNNLLIELYIVIDIKSYIMSPNSYKEFKNSYEIIGASKVVMGKIPLYFGDSIEQSSAIVSS